MPSCPNSRARRRAAALGAALLLLSASGAAAQVGPPVRLLPPPPGAGPAIPDRPAAPPPVPAGTTDDSIRSTPLAPVDASWIGTLDEGSHPLPQTMWAGSSRALIRAALPLLGPTQSPAWQDLARRLLLSNAASPSGQDPADAPSLALLRIERLMAQGEIDGALAVIDALPGVMRGEQIDHDRVELHFAKNDAEGACRLVQDGVARYQGVWWARALIACQALAGDQAKATLGMSLLREQKAPADPVFDALIDAVGAHHPLRDKLASPSPMLVTLLAAAKLPLPQEALAAADATTLAAWAGNEAVPPLQRLAAAERAAALGAIAPETLAALYAKVEFKPDELGAAIKQEKPPASPRDDALLYQVAHTDPAATARAAALSTLLDAAQKHGLFILMARVVAPILVELPPSQDLAAVAPLAVRALYAGGRPDAATPWLTFVDPAAAPLLLPLTRLALGTTGDDQALQDALNGLGRKDAARADLLLALLAALGTPVAGADLAPLIGPAHPGLLPSAALWTDQLQAASAKRVGETVLATLVIARGADDRLGTEPVVLSRVVTGLRAVGLDVEARALALEAALDAGI